MIPASSKIRALVGDDSAIVRKLLADAIREEPDMEVVGVAADPFVARDLILQRKPDVITLDIEMPRMDGLTFLRPAEGCCSGARSASRPATATWWSSASACRCGQRFVRDRQSTTSVPAVDVLFNAVARLQGLPIVGVPLTGMGAEGADGMMALRRAGAESIAEDEHSCVVFGMPKEAIARGGATHIATLLRIPALIFECFDRLAGGQVA